jgi:TolA-binding protein
MKNAIYIVLIISLAACSSVRRNSSGSEKIVVPDSKPATENISQRPRFSDTTTIVLPTVMPPVQSVFRESDFDIKNELDRAVRDFNSGKFSSACQKIRVYAETIDPVDSIYFEAKFYESECFITKDNLDLAKETLLEILRNDYIPNSTAQRCLVRVGQIYCAQGKHDIAETFFTTLRQRFPESIYIPIANCESVE